MTGTRIDPPESKFINCGPNGFFLFQNADWYLPGYPNCFSTNIINKISYECNTKQNLANKNDTAKASKGCELRPDPSYWSSVDKTKCPLTERLEWVAKVIFQCADRTQMTYDTLNFIKMPGCTLLDPNSCYDYSAIVINQIAIVKPIRLNDTINCGSFTVKINNVTTWQSAGCTSDPTNNFIGNCQNQDKCPYPRNSWLPASCNRNDYQLQVQYTCTNTSVWPITFTKEFNCGFNQVFVIISARYYAPKTTGALSRYTSCWTDVTPFALAKCGEDTNNCSIEPKTWFANNAIPKPCPNYNETNDGIVEVDYRCIDR